MHLRTLEFVLLFFLLGGITFFKFIMKRPTASQSEANMKRAERFNLGNHGPPNVTKEDELEIKRRTMQSVANNLNISFRVDESFKAVPSRPLIC